MMMGTHWQDEQKKQWTLQWPGLTVKRQQRNLRNFGEEFREYFTPEGSSKISTYKYKYNGDGNGNGNDMYCRGRDGNRTDSRNT
jgi:hypothetical protein